MLTDIVRIFRAIEDKKSNEKIWLSPLVQTYTAACEGTAKLLGKEAAGCLQCFTFEEGEYSVDM